MTNDPGRRRRARFMEAAFAWTIRAAAIGLAAAIWTAILAQEPVNRPFVLELWAAHAWLLGCVIVGLASGGYVAKGALLNAPLQRVLLRLRVVFLFAAAGYLVGLFIPPTGAGVANPLAYPAVVGAGAIAGAVRNLLAARAAARGRR